MTVAASSKIELALCFEDVAKNIFKSPDGTMTGCVVAHLPLQSEPKSGVLVVSISRPKR